MENNKIEQESVESVDFSFQYVKWTSFQVFCGGWGMVSGFNGAKSLENGK